jgi:hypothetical protein
MQSKAEAKPKATATATANAGVLRCAQNDKQLKKATVTATAAFSAPCGLGPCVRVGFAGRLLSGDEGKALDGDFCAAACAFPGGQEDYGDFIESSDCGWSWDGESQNLFHGWTVQGNLRSFAGCDCSLCKILIWLSDGT